MMLSNKVIIITGSTSGIGAAIARRCVSEGARVLIHGIDEEGAQKITSELGKAAVYHIDDLIDSDAPERIVKAAIDAFGQIDGIVNNAAWIIRSELETTDAAMFDRVMSINVRAPMLLIRAAISHLKKTEGSVVGIGSVNAYTGEPRQLAYAMSKAAFLTLSRNLANSYGPQKVRFNHFNVGWVLTEREYNLKVKEGLGKDWPEEMAGSSEVPAGRMTRPEDIAEHAVFWLSDVSRPISGAVIDLEQFPVVGRIPLKEGDQ